MQHDIKHGNKYKLFKSRTRILLIFLSFEKIIRQNSYDIKFFFKSI